MTIIHQVLICMSNLTFGGSDESYLRSRVQRSAERATKTQGFFCERQAYALRGRVFAASFLHPYWLEEGDCNRGPLEATKQSLQRWRTVAGHHLSDDSRSGTDRDHATVAEQRCLSILERTVALSERHHPETVSPAPGSRGVAARAQTSRSVSLQDECQTAPASPADFRFGFHGLDRLRKTRSGPDWLSPVQTGTPVLPSLALFRRTNKRLLARRTASRPCLYGCRSSRPAGHLFWKNSYRGQTSYHSRRQGFLRSQDVRLARGPKGTFCDRSQVDSGHQATTLWPALPPSWWQCFDRTVPLPAVWVAAPISLRGYSTTANRRIQRATDAVQNGPVFLSSVRHQSHVAAVESMAFLQRSGGRGTNHSRTQKRLSLGQNSHASFLGQRNLFSSFVASLQSRQLVQATLSSRRVPERYPGHSAQPDFSDASATAASRQSSSACYAPQRRPRKSLEVCLD